MSCFTYKALAPDPKSLSCANKHARAQIKLSHACKLCIVRKYIIMFRLPRCDENLVLRCDSWSVRQFYSPFWMNWAPNKVTFYDFVWNYSKYLGCFLCITNWTCSVALLIFASLQYLITYSTYNFISFWFCDIDHFINIWQLSARLPTFR